MSKVLVVGGAGYIGSVLLEQLVEQNYEVTIVDTFLYGKTAIPKACVTVQSDMKHLDPNIMRDHEAVINLGGFSNDPTANYNPETNWELNTHCAVALAEMCRSQGIPKYILASSCSLYDRQNLDSDSDELLSETSRIQPVGHYSQSKFAAENSINRLRTAEFTPIILRKGTVFGLSPRMRFDLVVNTMIKDAIVKGKICLHKGGEMWRPMIEVKDVAHAYIRALQTNIGLEDNIFNISYKNFRISEVGLRVINELKRQGCECEIEMDYSLETTRNYRVNNSKAREVLGFSPSIEIEQAVADIYQKYKANFEELMHPRQYNIEWMKLVSLVKSS
ncbi:NAD-dependent epimerase/dehydratase family protein [Paenibacillus sp. MMS18-CY102]|uniref:NAD-dependent epimerase/dehydratase family protein n=1 Tax=Paenibacillus sp. MMS18-CY102 TaxID=2682849 RepID=UPI0013661287|nr:NAD(P)-dependent oxidoreductase [Paenibacillus sp. MMS18-CY102]MWC27629.1 NAD-dependent epimerase/dehydratase family protein [Paenibacillus sp. MMS18-CY102]